MLSYSLVNVFVVGNDCKTLLLLVMYLNEMLTIHDLSLFVVCVSLTAIRSLVEHA